MPDQDLSAAEAAFTEHRNLLFTVAYELLGSAADAEDVVQESWLRWSQVDHASIRDARGYLVRVVSRQALNHVRSLSRRREAYVGPWLPEPVLTAPDVAEDAELADSVSLAMLVVLDTLKPVERAVFVLREVFGFEYDEVAAAVGRSPEATRQVAHRARKHVHKQRPRHQAGPEAQKVAASFFAATASGDVQQLLDVLAPDVVLLTDGGGKMKAALRPLRGADKVARFLAAVRPPTDEFEVEWRSVNGTPSVLLHMGGRLDSVVSVRVENDRVVELYFVRNPDKLVGFGEERRLSRG